MASMLSKKCSIAAVSAVMIGGTALLAVPAEAVSQTLTYTCPVGGADRQFKLTADTTLPDTAVAGSDLTAAANSTVVIGNDVRDLMYGLFGAREVKGTASIETTTFGAPATLAATIPLTPVPSAGDLTVPAAAPVALKAPATAGVHEIHAGDFSAVVTLVKEDKSEVGPITLDCTLDAGQNTLIDTLNVTAPTTTPTPTPTPTVTPTPTTAPVVKVATTTTAKAKYAAASKKATVKVLVKAATGTPTGKVAVTVKKGAKKIKTITVNLSAGKAKAVFKKISAQGKYKVSVKYAGSTTTNTSSARTTFKVA